MPASPAMETNNRNVQTAETELGRLTLRAETAEAVRDVSCADICQCADICHV